MMPFGWVTPLSGLVFGVLFGWVLQRGGLGNSCRLTAQLRLQDWTVFNVMFTAIITASVGLYALQFLGLVQLQNLFIPTTYLWATLAGGALVGAGMGVGGYCPGTSVVGAAGGRLDGIVFFVGLVLGVLIFADAFDHIAALLTAAPGPQGQTVASLLHIPNWLVLVLLIAAATAVGFLTRRQKASHAISCAD